MTPARHDILVSVVSHGHGAWVASLLRDLALPGNAEHVRVVLTLNVPELLDFDPAVFPFPVAVLENARPRGFSSNHNRAFREGLAQGGARFFCVLNPDVSLAAGTMRDLLACFAAAPAPALVAPAVLSPEGVLEDSARPLPSPTEILGKAGARLFGRAGRTPAAGGCDWVAGMFMLFTVEAFAAMDGFDEAYFLYYEDVDICCRLALRGYRMRYCASVRVVHHARRDSHRQWAYLSLHARSALRFYTSSTYFRCRARVRAGQGGWVTTE